MATQPYDYLSQSNISTGPSNPSAWGGIQPLPTGTPATLQPSQPGVNPQGQQIWSPPTGPISITPVTPDWNAPRTTTPIASGSTQQQPGDIYTTQPVYPTTPSQTTPLSSPPTSGVNLGNPAMGPLYAMPNVPYNPGQTVFPSQPTLGGLPTDLEGWKDPKVQAAIAAFIPFAQQMGMTPNEIANMVESIRRFDIQQPHQMSMDIGNLTLGQGGLAEEIRRTDIGHDEYTRSQDWTEKIGTQQEARELFTTEANAWYQKEGIRQGDVQLGINQQAADTEDAYKKGLISNDLMRIGIETFVADTDRTVREKANAIEEMRVKGDLDDRSARLAFDKLTEQHNEAYRYAKMLEDSVIARENMANQLTMARYAAFGRNQAPNTRWAASWR